MVGLTLIIHLAYTVNLLFRVTPPIFPYTLFTNLPL